jgi:lambda family phage portal protein
MAAQQHWLDRVVSLVAPRLALDRQRARLALEVMRRHYDAASDGRRTQGWKRTGADANAVLGPAMLRMREHARDLVRNNPYAESALGTIVDHAVGWGITPKTRPRNERAEATWKAWAETTACDADGRHDFYGLQQLAFRTVVESGEVLVRRRWRRPEDGVPLGFQLQLLEPDYLDTNKTMGLPTGGRIIYGVEYDPLGRRVAYWLYPEHPGATLMASSSTILGASRRVEAKDVLHVFEAKRAGQVRAATWFAGVILRLKDLDEFEDATLMKQKIAACLSVVTSDVDGAGTALGVADDAENPGADMLEPGAILNLQPGRTVDIVQPPTAGDFVPYTQINLRAIAAGLGIPYEDLTGDYTNLPFSAARMSQKRHWLRVERWRWRTIVPQFCTPVWAWAAQAAQIAGLPFAPAEEVRWTAPPAPMIEPDKEGLAAQRNMRSGIQSPQEAIRERGYDPDELLEEMAEWNAKLDAAGIVLDSDPRKTTQAGQSQAMLAGSAAKAPASDTPSEPPPAAEDETEDTPTDDSEDTKEAKQA